MDREQFCGKVWCNGPEWGFFYGCGVSFRDYLGDDYDHSKAKSIDRLYYHEEPENDFSFGYGISLCAYQSYRTTYIYTY